MLWFARLRQPRRLSISHAEPQGRRGCKEGGGVFVFLRPIQKTKHTGRGQGREDVVSKVFCLVKSPTWRRFLALFVFADRYSATPPAGSAHQRLSG